MANGGVSGAAITVIAFDYGLKRIGVAVGQSVTGTSSPLTILKARDGIPDWSAVGALFSEWAPDKVVVGYPLNMDGTTSDMANRAAKFARRLTGRFNVVTELADERLTSYEAGRSIDGAPIDDVAATIILDSWFRTRSGSGV